jgi:hypothetical protein
MAEADEVVDYTLAIGIVDTEDDKLSAVHPPPK